VIKDADPDNSFGEIGMLVGVAWKEISDDTKAEREEKVEQDNIRYKNEINEYSAPSDDNDSNENVATTTKGGIQEGRRDAGTRHPMKVLKT
jgi:hypothetical protein